MRNRFDKKLENIKTELIEMGALCEKSIEIVLSALKTGDSGLASMVFQYDSSIDEKQKEIESLGLKLLLQQQPVAKDLRQISASLKMINDMERIGDQAADIANVVTEMDGKTSEKCELIEYMAKETISMVSESIEAFVREDKNLAEKTIEHDDIVDDYLKQIKKYLVKMIGENAEDGEYALNLLIIARYLERIGDHAVNIARNVLFAITGEYEREKE